jgi:hypothetical protein
VVGEWVAVWVVDDNWEGDEGVERMAGEGWVVGA